MSARNFNIFKAKKYGNVKVEHNLDSPKGEVIHVTLHKTVVVRADLQAGRVTLNSGGWQTVTTKAAINSALRQIPGFERVFLAQVKGDWFVQTAAKSLPFEDGMILQGTDGLPIRRIG